MSVVDVEWMHHDSCGGIRKAVYLFSVIRAVPLCSLEGRSVLTYYCVKYLVMYSYRLRAVTVARESTQV